MHLPLFVEDVRPGRPVLRSVMQIALTAVAEAPSCPNIVVRMHIVWVMTHSAFSNCSSASRYSILASSTFGSDFSDTRYSFSCRRNSGQSWSGLNDGCMDFVASRIPMDLQIVAQADVWFPNRKSPTHKD